MGVEMVLVAMALAVVVVVGGEWSERGVVMSRASFKFLKKILNRAYIKGVMEVLQV
jgi:hypothetical protein